VQPGTLHAAILRSPHPHAKIRVINAMAARTAPGVAAVITGAEVTAVSGSLGVGVKAPIECWPIAVERVRYVGEPVAVVLAGNRYLAEDALELIEVDYEPQPAIIDPLAALDPKQLPLHEGLGSNVASERSFRYGDPARVCTSRSSRVGDDPLSAQFVHADRNLRSRRRV
jgi:2-furoyl-CoA dehydrogenase large subunit